jgi:hypothetical protein
LPLPGDALSDSEKKDLEKVAAILSGSNAAERLTILEARVDALLYPVNGGGA